MTPRGPQHCGATGKLADLGSYFYPQTHAHIKILRNDAAGGFAADCPGRPDNGSPRIGFPDDPATRRRAEARTRRKRPGWRRICLPRHGADDRRELSRKSGGRVARVSLKTRNPLLGQPDAWEQQVLAEFDRRAAAGEKIESLEFSGSTNEPRGRYFRYMKAIPVQLLCLTCHGKADNIPDQVRARLAMEYPHDRAIGYELGQVRGAVTIKQPIGTDQ